MGNTCLMRQPPQPSKRIFIVLFFALAMMMALMLPRPTVVESQSPPPTEEVLFVPAGDTMSLTLALAYASNNGRYGIHHKIYLEGGTYTFGFPGTAAEPQIPPLDSKVTVYGNNATLIFRLKRPFAADEAPILVFPGAEVNFHHLVLKTSDGWGRLINNQGNLTISDSTLSIVDNQAGGGILNSGQLTLLRSTLSGNVARSQSTVGGPNGGALFNSGLLTATCSRFLNNRAAQGGALYNAQGGSFTITKSDFQGNLANGGGAIFNASTAVMRAVDNRFGTIGQPQVQETAWVADALSQRVVFEPFASSDPTANVDCASPLAVALPNMGEQVSRLAEAVPTEVPAPSIQLPVGEPLSAPFAYPSCQSSTLLYQPYTCLKIVYPDGSLVQIDDLNIATYNDSVRWSPDGKSVLYRSWRNGIDAIYVLNLETRRDAVVHYVNFATDTPTWSADSTEVIYTLHGGRILATKVDGTTLGNPRLLYQSEVHYGLAFMSPDGKTILAKRDSPIRASIFANFENNRIDLLQKDPLTNEWRFQRTLLLFSYYSLDPAECPLADRAMCIYEISGVGWSHPSQPPASEPTQNQPFVMLRFRAGIERLIPLDYGTTLTGFGDQLPFVPLNASGARISLSPNSNQVLIKDTLARTTESNVQVGRLFNTGPSGPLVRIIDATGIGDVGFGPGLTLAICPWGGTFISASDPRNDSQKNPKEVQCQYQFPDANRQQAAQWAMNWSTNACPLFCAFQFGKYATPNPVDACAGGDNTDCANFVSQALFFGGLPMNEGWACEFPEPGSTTIVCVRSKPASNDEGYTLGWAHAPRYDGLPAYVGNRFNFAKNIRGLGGIDTSNQAQLQGILSQKDSAFLKDNQQEDPASDGFNVDSKNAQTKKQVIIEVSLILDKIGIRAGDIMYTTRRRLQHVFLVVGWGPYVETWAQLAQFQAQGIILNPLSVKRSGVNVVPYVVDHGLHAIWAFENPNDPLVGILGTAKPYYASRWGSFMNDTDYFIAGDRFFVKIPDQFMLPIDDMRVPRGTANLRARMQIVCP
jgi:Putative amidase domain/WD40-like Beta Propeller Repeat